MTRFKITMLAVVCGLLSGCGTLTVEPKTDPALMETLNSINEKLDKPAPHMPVAPVSADDFAKFQDEFHEWIKQHPNEAFDQLSGDVRGLAAKIDQETAVRKLAEVKPVGVPAPRKTYTLNATGQQVIWYYTTQNCVPGIVFERDGHLVRINGQPVDWRPWNTLPVTLDTPTQCPVFAWESPRDGWVQIIGWDGPIDFQSKFSRPARASSAFQAAPPVQPLQFATYGSPGAMLVTYGAPIVTHGDPIDVPVIRTAIVPVTRPGPLGLLWHTRMERVAY